MNRNKTTGTKMRHFQISFISLLALAIIITSTANLMAVAPSPEYIAKSADDPNFAAKMERLRAFKAEGACSPSEHSTFNLKDISGLASAATVDTARVLVLLVDFDDHVSNGSTYNQGATTDTTDFWNLLFSIKDRDSMFNPTGSMTEYFLENSYDQLHIEGDVKGWLRMPQTYAFYVLDDIDNGTTRSRILAADALQAASDAGIDLSRYDFDGDGYCDGLVILHAGMGAEEDEFGIWSHKFGLTSPVTYGGVSYQEYVIGAEEFHSAISPIGIITHEFGHYLQLIDLYDLQAGQPGREYSEGLGSWSLMASGNYNNSAKTPAHMDAWSKIEVGFVTPIDLFGNLDSVAIPQVETNPVIYRLRNLSVSANEYWLVENRQKTGFDTFLRTSGLCIYHVDNAMRFSGVPGHYFVGLVQADGNDDLSFTEFNTGDAGDTWPGFTNNRNFHDLSFPSSRTYPDLGEDIGNSTQIAVWDISDSDSLMYADLDVTYSRPWTVLDSLTPFAYESVRNGFVDQSIQPGDTVNLFFNARNLMRETFKATASVISNNSEISMIDSEAMITVSIFGVGPHSNQDVGDMISFVMPDSIRPIVDSFFVTITSDSTLVNSTVSYSEQFGFTLQLGPATVMVVDDDRGDSHEIAYRDALERMKIPVEFWETQTDGLPTQDKLSNFPIVIWETGDSTRGALDVQDIQVMKSYLDNGGNLLLASKSGLKDMQTFGPSFLSDYLHTAAVTDSFALSGLVIGNPDEPQWSDLRLLLAGGAADVSDFPIITPIAGATSVFHFESGGQSLGDVGVAYNGLFKTLFFTVSPTRLNNSLATFDTIDSVLASAFEFFGIGYKTDIYVDKNENILPLAFELKQNYPNPFNPTTTISFTITATTGGQSTQPTKLGVYNLLGQEVVVLVDSKLKQGNYSVQWDGKSSSGNSVASGVYFYRLQYGKQVDMKKMVFLK